MQTVITTTGRLTEDFELQTAKNGGDYTQFGFAVNKGYGDKEHPNFFQCVAFGGNVERLMKAGVKKGSLLAITGDLDLVDFTRKGDGSKGTTAKITLHDWCYAPTSRPKAEPSAPPASGYPDDGFLRAGCDEELPFN